MKKSVVLFVSLVVLAVLVMLFVLRDLTYAGGGEVIIEDYGDCNIVGERYVVRYPNQIHICKVMGASQHPAYWNGRKSLTLQGMGVWWGWDSIGPGCRTWVHSSAHDVYRSDFCDPVTGKKRSRSSAPGPISLPKRQKYLLLNDGQMWCYTIVQTPILSRGGKAWCKVGSAPEDINDFCLQPNYQSLSGCMLENYEVRHVSYRRMKAHRR